jgi:hypothetical protein
MFRTLLERRNRNHRRLNHKSWHHMGCSLSHKVLNNNGWTSYRSNHPPEQMLS